MGKMGSEHREGISAERTDFGGIGEVWSDCKGFGSA